MSGFEDRKDYVKGRLDLADVADVRATVDRWLQDAKEVDPNDYNAMTLSTMGHDGHPNARIVLVRSLEDTPEGPALAFYTNYNSAKGREIEAHPHAAATFFWREIERQLRIRGRVLRMDSASSDRYFASRPRDSRIGAWASQQSEEVPSRDVMEEEWMRYNERYPEAVPRPPHWGGFLLLMESVEFWQGRPGRMHDRIAVRRGADGWSAQRLQP